jgi:transcriptional regulator with XRE-family HTH domain
MGRKQTLIGHSAGDPIAREGWARAYRIEWGEVVGHRVRRLRTTHGWSLRDLSHRVPKPEGGFYSLGYFSRLERGWTSPPFYVYVKLAAAFDVHPGDLLGVEEFDRNLTREEAMLLRIVEGLGLTPDEAVVRLTSATQGGA